MKLSKQSLNNVITLLNDHYLQLTAREFFFHYNKVESTDSGHF